MTPEQARRFAGYNRWANGRLYGAVEALPEAERRRDLQAFFGSLHGTLNHLLVADLIWLERLGVATGDIHERPRALDQILFEAFGALARARAAADARLAELCDGETPERLAEPLGYQVRGETWRQPRWQILAHLFNHQTHHRGQAHGLLTRLGREAPPLDLLYYLRETA